MLQLSLIFGVCAIPFLIFYIWWWKRQINGLPMLKSVFPLGHLWYAVSMKNIPNNSIFTYYYNFFMGNARIFKEGIFYFRLFFFNFVFLTSPETAQVERTQRANNILYGWHLHPLFVLRKIILYQAFYSNTKEFMKADVYLLFKRYIGDGLVTSNDEDFYLAHRKVLRQTFNKNMLERFQIVFNRQASTLCKVLLSKDKKIPISISKLVDLCTYDIMFESLSGRNIAAQKHPGLNIIKVSHEMAEQFMKGLVTMWKNNSIVRNLFPSEVVLEKNLQWANNFYQKELDNKKKLVADEVMRISTGEEYRGCDDHPCLFDLLLRKQLQNEKFFNEKMVLEEVKTFISAGFDTTAGTLEWMFFLIGNYPVVQDKIHQELDEILGTDRDRDITTQDLNSLKYLTMVIKETQRLHPAIPLIGRKLIKNMEIGGKFIPKGTQIVLLIGSIHMDPNHFENPEEFIPERFAPENSTNRHPFAFIPFSAGQRNCPGSTFAMRSILTITASVLLKFSIKSVLKRDKISTKWIVKGCPNQDIELYFRPRK